MNEENILRVKNLKISFKTNTGTVKAVRGISFDLKKGKTLAIVGESGSGKSVTSKAILGISANNVIVEDGEIIYDGKDLLTLSEENFSKIRGTKVSMIFQDPLSALNPIKRVGAQLTETMILETKSTRKYARKDVAYISKYLNQAADKETRSGIELAKKAAAKSVEIEVRDVKGLTSIFNKCLASKSLKDDELAAKYAIKISDFASKFDGSYADTKVAQEKLEAIIESSKNIVSHLKEVIDGIPQVTNEAIKAYTNEYLDALKSVVAKVDNAEDRKLVKKIESQLIEANGPGMKKHLKAFREKPLEEIDTEVFALNTGSFTNVLELQRNKEIEAIQVAINAIENVVNNILVKHTAKGFEQNEFFQYKETFAKAIALSNQEFIKNAEEAIAEAKRLNDTILKEYNSSEVKMLIPNMRIIFPLLKKCHSIIFLSADNVIDIYATMMKNYAQGIINNIAYNAHLEKVLAKNGVESFYDLKPELRCKERETTKDPQEYFQSMQKLNNKLIARLEELKELYSKEASEEDVSKLISAYAKAVADTQAKLSSSEARERAINLMREVGIPYPEKRFNQYPFEFSGGMRQRIVIAIALSGNPEVLICDEPTTALDVTIQAQILELINRLKAEKNLSIIFITHDLGVVANMADDIAVMYAGKIVEYGTVYDIFYDPRHPYTWALLGSMPDLDTKGKLDAIPGTPPNMLLPPRGDAFAARNNYAIALDYEQEAPFFKISETHSAKTWLAHESAIDVEPPKTVADRIENSLKNNPINIPTYDLKKNSILEYIKNRKN